MSSKGRRIQRYRVNPFWLSGKAAVAREIAERRARREAKAQAA